MSKLTFDQSRQLTWLKQQADIGHQTVSSCCSGERLMKISFFTCAENYLAY
ncbi:MAG: hypothetical protein J0H92_04045 [Sphingobacteriales bacterium]|jgi:hypothetical protein|nr:hypothetical protein [Sphingobacteriales bacterium]NCT77017.1 hypothetical protein [Chitinophagaceae bacterium]